MGMEVGEEGDYIPIATPSPPERLLHRDESHFNVSLIVKDKVTRRCPQTTTCEEKGEPKRIPTAVPLLTTEPNAFGSRSP